MFWSASGCIKKHIQDSTYQHSTKGNLLGFILFIMFHSSIIFYNVFQTPNWPSHSGFPCRTLEINFFYLSLVSYIIGKLRPSLPQICQKWLKNRIIKEFSKIPLENNLQHISKLYSVLSKSILGNMCNYFYGIFFFLSKWAIFSKMTWNACHVSQHQILVGVTKRQIWNLEGLSYPKMYDIYIYKARCNSVRPSHMEDL